MRQERSLKPVVGRTLRSDGVVSSYQSGSVGVWVGKTLQGKNFFHQFNIKNIALHEQKFYNFAKKLFIL